MTEIKLEPVKQIMIQELTQEDRENFLYRCYVRGAVIRTWVDGMIIELMGSTSGDSEYVDMTKGSEYYEDLVFVKLPKYKKSIKWDGGNYELRLINQNNNSKLREIAKWIKSQPVWEKIPERLEV